MRANRRLQPPRPPPTLTPAQAKRRLGGKFPAIKGGKYRYPAPTNKKGWTSLVNRALQQKYKDDLARYNGKPVPKCQYRRKFEYILWHCSPIDRKRRNIRGQHRAMHGLGKGDDRVVHHIDQDTLDFNRTVVLTHCQHQAIHGKACRPCGAKRRKARSGMC